MKEKIGVWAFIGGLIIAAGIAIFSSSSTPTWAVPVIAILGLIVGFLNVSESEVKMYLIASIAFLLVGYTVAFGEFGNDAMSQ